MFSDPVMIFENWSILKAVQKADALGMVQGN